MKAADGTMKEVPFRKMWNPMSPDLHLVMTMNIDTYIAESRKIVDQYLERLLPPEAQGACNDP